MEFYQELLLTAVVSLLIALLVGKLVGLDADDASSSSPETTTVPAATAQSVPISDKQRLEPRPAAADAAVVLGSDPIVSNEAAEAMSVSSSPVVDEAGSEGGSGWDGVEVEIVRSPDEMAAERERVGEEGGSRGDDGSGIEESVGSLLLGEDEWEGVERSELAELFGSAAAYADSVMPELSSDVQMELYALHKVAMEGPCYEAQPLALKVSARAKWHAWQSLGNMNPDVAMEHYICLLSHNIPGWMRENPAGDAKLDEGNDLPAQGVIGSGTPGSGSSLYNQRSSIIGSKTEDLSDGDHSSAGSELARQGLAKTLFLNLLSPTTVRF